MSKLQELLQLIATHHGINDKTELTRLIVEKFGLTQDRSVELTHE